MNSELLLKAERVGAGSCVAGYERSVCKPEADDTQNPLFDFYSW